MKSISERPPILTVHEDQGDYILRVGDTRYRHLVVGLSKLLTDARRLIVVTPGDVKFFTMEGDDGNGPDSSATTPPDDIGGTDDPDLGSSEVTSQLPQQEELEEMPKK